MSVITTKRAYEKAEKGDGARVLVDRLWPRGLSKQKIKIDAWEKDLAPSTELRQWFNHDPKKWSEFKKRYKVELKTHKAELAALKKSAKRLTLVYGAKDTKHNEAVVLRDILEKL